MKITGKVNDRGDLEIKEQDIEQNISGEKYFNPYSEYVITSSNLDHSYIYIPDVNPNKSPKFKEGDIVSIINYPYLGFHYGGPSSWAGKIGEIKEVRLNKGREPYYSYMLTISKDTVCLMHERELILKEYNYLEDDE